MWGTHPVLDQKPCLRKFFLPYLYSRIPFLTKLLLGGSYRLPSRSSNDYLGILVLVHPPTNILVHLVNDCQVGYSRIVSQHIVPNHISSIDPQSGKTFHFGLSPIATSFHHLVRLPSHAFGNSYQSNLEAILRETISKR